MTGSYPFVCCPRSYTRSDNDTSEHHRIVKWEREVCHSHSPLPEMPDVLFVPAGAALQLSVPRLALQSGKVAPLHVATTPRAEVPHDVPRLVMRGGNLHLGQFLWFHISVHRIHTRPRLSTLTSTRCLYPHLQQARSVIFPHGAHRPLMTCLRLTPLPRLASLFICRPLSGSTRAGSSGPPSPRGTAR
jgi:hypothetical protein